MKKIKPYIFFFLLVLSSCTSRESANQEIENDLKAVHKHEELEIIDEQGPTNGPSCNTDIKKIGIKEQPKGVVHIYFTAANVNLNNEACSFTIGEIASNEVPDSGIRNQFIYFIDTPNFKIPDDTNIFGSEEIKKKIIYRFSEGGDKMEFYPFNQELRQKIQNPLK